jgi:hypothetical protein
VDFLLRKQTTLLSRIAHIAKNKDRNSRHLPRPTSTAILRTPTPLARIACAALIFAGQLSSTRRLPQSRSDSANTAERLEHGVDVSIWSS